MSSPWTAPGTTPRPEDEHPAGAELSAAAEAAPAPAQRELVARSPLFPLRPLGLGEILGAAVRIYRARPKLTLGLSAVVYGIAYVISTFAAGASMLPLVGQMQAIADSPNPENVDIPTSTTDIVGTVISSAASGAIMLVASSIVTLALTAVAIRTATGEGADSAALRALLRERWLRTVLASVVVALIGLVVLLVPITLGAIPLLLMREATVLTIGVLVLGLLAGLLAALYITVRTSLVVPVIAVEGPGAIGAVRRAFALTAGRRLWRIAGIYLLLVVIAGFAVQIVSGVFGMIGTVAYIAILVVSGFQQIVLALAVLTIFSMLGGFVATVLLAPFQSAGTAALYADARMCHEAWDIELTERARAARGAPADLGGGIR